MAQTQANDNAAKSSTWRRYLVPGHATNFICCLRREEVRALKQKLAGATKAAGRCKKERL
jgi:hypothetical protein